MPLGDYPLYVTIPASDLSRARRFYEETLGFKNPEERDDGIRYTSGSSKFLLYESQFAGTNQATLAAWDVEDLDRVVAELREAGVTFEQYDFPGLKTDENGIASIGNLRGAWFKDTEGNILSVGDH